ncbi:TetR family transcriptional regulator [Saccharibacillus sp. CPCC 101409]|uniref:TetR family transcriptional regulator n=1 Tax=Saccharibacillus sp. CPCC 101409 TaxID=3058041 RepID=UPI002672A966|nr:TetR family transcriptional regulator [Saccharibacillus sp. CPCC 101409]MDO3412494.1 TetR family transcriptional regulator [Saccharibacillus sp. CPCC 101409]
MNREDPRVLRTRRLIRESFRTLLRSKGFESITIKDIARQAVINRATFYSHYEDKYALLDEITEQAFLETMPEQAREARQFTDEVCELLILATYRYTVDFYRTCRMDSKSIATLVDRKMKSMLQETIETILLRTEDIAPANRRRAKMAAAITGAAIYSAAYEWLTIGDDDSTGPLVETTLPYIMNGMNELLLELSGPAIKTGR